MARRCATSGAIPDNSVSLVLLAGGVGKRMGASIPKQYLQLCGQPIATYSLATFAGMPEVGEVVVVCEPEWRDVFTSCHSGLPRKLPLKFASPGAERQDSVLSGFQVGAAVLGVPVKPTIKEVDAERRVVKTLQRAKLWEVIRPALLRAGFELVRREGLEVTDDVSIIEALGEPVQITPGAYTNIKVTTPDDMQASAGTSELTGLHREATGRAQGRPRRAARPHVAERFLEEQQQAAADEALQFA
eukprot:scaffold22.g6085.t1